jgi:hypothetical protein
LIKFVKIMINVDLFLKLFDITRSEV